MNIKDSTLEGNCKMILDEIEYLNECYKKLIIDSQTGTQLEAEINSLVNRQVIKLMAIDKENHAFK